MKIYTKTGDKGQTSLFGGARIPKNHIRIESYGTVDELNSHLGLLISHLDNENTKALLLTIQHQLFNIGSCLAIDPESDIKLPSVSESDIKVLEDHMDLYNEELPKLTNFILPGGSVANAQCHVCRTVCRRAERNTIALNTSDAIDPIIIKYLNRLSDYFFVLSRYISFLNKSPEILWVSK